MLAIAPPVPKPSAAPDAEDDDENPNVKYMKEHGFLVSFRQSVVSVMQISAAQFCTDEHSSEISLVKVLDHYNSPEHLSLSVWLSALTCRSDNVGLTDLTADASETRRRPSDRRYDGENRRWRNG